MEEVIELCKKIKLCSTSCQLCGGTIENCSCIYCGKKSEELEELTNRLTEKIAFLKQEENLDYIPVCKAFNYLYSIKNFKIEDVNDILNKANYDKKLEEELEKIVNKEDKSIDITKEEYELVNLLLINGDIKQYKINWCNFFIKSLTNKKFHIEYEDLEKMIIMYSEELMKDACHIDEAKCTIEVFKEKDRHGEANKNIIHIDRNEFDDLYQNFNADNMFKIFNTIFHEVTHVNQYSRRMRNNISFYDSIMIKDFILRNSLKDYYDDNYYLSTEEIEAFIEGYRTALNYTEFMGLKISDELKRDESYRVEGFKKVVTNLNRKYQGNYIPIDNLFHDVVTLDMLKEYTILQLEYVVENDCVRRKTLEELDEEYDGYINGILNLNGKKDEIIYYFNYLENTLENTKKNAI